MKKRICLLITCFSFMSAYSANHKVTGSIKDIVQNSIPASHHTDTGSRLLFRQRKRDG